jgi:DNA-directed RNA polymerase subunit RPC12/RpoP
MKKITDLNLKINNVNIKNEVHLFCNDCGYKWIIFKNLDDYDFEEFEDENILIHCPICGSDNIDEIF